ncbi:MAG: RHS repeat protein [Verrucomicrobiae bacterium]|nr:RHS repeat protein [Verrucomicrobiae bacterium]
MKLLNQYTSRTVPGYLEVSGLVLGNNTITVNSSAPWRKGEFFRKELTVANGSVPVWQSISVAAPGETTVSGNVFVPKTPEAFTYDADGNLTQDGRWDYTWDAENRLVKLESRSGAPNGSKRKLEFAYDWRGRRIGKKVTNLDTSTVLSEEKFLYDGWNLIAKLNSSFALVQSYLWGLDLSGSMQGAGGVGGLLAVTDVSAGSHFASCF